MELSSSCCTEINILYSNLYSYTLETCVSGNLCSFLKNVKPFVLYDVEHGIALETMKGKRASYQVDLGYTSYFSFLR